MATDKVEMKRAKFMQRNQKYVGSRSAVSSTFDFEKPAIRRPSSED